MVSRVHSSCLRPPVIEVQNISQKKQEKYVLSAGEIHEILKAGQEQAIQSALKVVQKRGAPDVPNPEPGSIFSQHTLYGVLYEASKWRYYRVR